MPGMGKAPKKPEERRNRRKPLAGEWIQLPQDGYKGKIPSLAGYGLSKTTHSWWQKIWRTPMATMWAQGDVPALIELAILRERLLDGKVSVAPEVRLRSDQFGLTPKGRQERRWIIADDIETEATGDVPDELKERRESRKERLTKKKPKPTGKRKKTTRARTRSS